MIDGGDADGLLVKERKDWALSSLILGEEGLGDSKSMCRSTTNDDRERFGLEWRRKN